jgi:hypothetical protein
VDFLLVVGLLVVVPKHFPVVLVEVDQIQEIPFQELPEHKILAAVLEVEPIYLLVSPVLLLEVPV